MLGQYLIILFLAVQIATTDKSDKSFVLVADTTASMREEIEVMKNNIQSVVEAARKRHFANYILLPFGDDHVGPPLVTSNPEYLLDLIHLVEVGGGRDCPEDSLAAIEKALQISKPKSYIYVFTDAQAKSQSRLEAIQQLCQSSGSQVVIFQSGKCMSEGLAQYDNANVYYEVANKCGGSVFHFHLGNLHHAFKYMKEITSVDWSNVDSHIEFTGTKRFTFIMDVYTKDFIVAVSGNYPKISITNSLGGSPQIEKIVDTRAFLVIRVKNAGIGQLTTDVTCQGTAVTTFYRRKEITFQVGFSPLKPKSLRETSLKPLPDVASYMLISLPEESPTELLLVQLQMNDNYETKMLQYRPLDGTRNVYIAEILIAAHRAFKVFIKCRDEVNNQEIVGYSNVLEPQRNGRERSVLRDSGPLIDLLDTESVLIDYGMRYTGACKVNADENPDIWWENAAKETLPSESALLEYPSTYISYVTIENATKNDTITCKCKDGIGEDAVSLNLYVNRTFTFEVLQFPTDNTIKFGEEAKLYCEANTFPEADIKWYHNDTLIEESENIQIVSDEHMLLIKNMGIDDTGEYKCEIANSEKSDSFLANIYITGLEPPQIEVNMTEILLKPGDFTEENCVVLKGIPFPEVSWKYKSENGDQYDPVPEGVIVDGNSLKIPAAETTHGGFYVCEAVNLIGSDSQDVKVKVQYAPKIKNGDEIMTVKEGEMVEMPCDVDAVPKADVHWDMYQDDVIIAFDDHHRVDDRNTHRFSARYNDSGMYHCIAVNEMGTATRTVTLNVLVPPYIEHLPWELLTVRAGTTTILPCDVTFGNPVPSTKWEYISLKFETTVLKRGHSMGKLDLVLGNITRRQEGTYQCVAENEVGPDTIKVYLKVF